MVRINNIPDYKSQPHPQPPEEAPKAAQHDLSTTEIIAVFKQKAVSGSDEDKIKYAKLIMKAAPQQSEDAVRLLEKIPDNPVAKNLLVDIYLNSNGGSKDVNKAIKLLEEHPDENSCKRLVAILEHENTPESLTIEKRVLAAKSEKGDAWANYKKGISLYAKGYEAEAKPFLQEYIKISERIYGKDQTRVREPREWTNAIFKLYMIDQSVSKENVNTSKDFRDRVTEHGSATINGKHIEFPGISPDYGSGVNYQEIWNVLDGKVGVEDSFHDSRFCHEYGKNMFRLGLVGGELCYKEAIRAWTKGAELGNKECMYCIGVCYQKGYGVEKSEEKAIQLWKNAMEGDSYSISAHKLLCKLDPSIKKAEDSKAMWKNVKEIVKVTSIVALSILSVLGAIIGLSFLIGASHLVVPVLVGTGAIVGATILLLGIIMSAGVAH